MKVFNCNIGILGHVDSGKTTLAKCLSEIGSVASFDRNPQSKERGITIDLGFSSFKLPLENEEILQITLVDCPGHASLIRSIIGGAQIIDQLILVVDITKGIQAQTFECIILAEILAEQNVTIILTKTDLLEKEKRQKLIDKRIQSLKKILSNKTKLKNLKFFPISLMSEDVENDKINLKKLLKEQTNIGEIRKRYDDNIENPQLLMAIDHSFQLTGVGTILTGTILRGKLSVGQMVEIPKLKESRKVKKIERFHESISRAYIGDRIAVCIQQLTVKEIGRCLAVTPDSMHLVKTFIIRLSPVKYFRHTLRTGRHFHLSLNYDTVDCTIDLFQPSNQPLVSYVSSREYEEEEEEKKKCGEIVIEKNFDLTRIYSYIEEIDCEGKIVDDRWYDKDNINNNLNKQIFAVVHAQRPFLLPKNEGKSIKLIGSQLDMTTSTSSDVSCRIAFSADYLISLTEVTTNEENTRMLTSDGQVEYKNQLKIYKSYERKGTVQRITDDGIICSNLVKKQSSIQPFIGCQVAIGEQKLLGIIQSFFGKSGKILITLFNSNPKIDLEKEKKKMKIGDEVLFKYRKYTYGFNSKRMCQG
ncbi:hypothetical protein SNEBB_005315 [Seison nebaliae]|nr:hypothetical protein SNEBB_005315 [Seison nebaliae]